MKAKESKEIYIYRRNRPPSGEQTHHVNKVIKYPSKDTLLSLNCSITVTLVIKVYLEINYLIIINNATILRH
jgi:hypothetical protein